MKLKLNTRCSLIIFLLVTSFLFSVNQNKDTLLKVLRSKTTDSCLIEANYLMGYQHTKAEWEIAEGYFIAAEKLCIKNNSPMISEVYRHRAIYFRSHGDFAHALDNINKSIEFATKFNHDNYSSMGHEFAGTKMIGRAHV